MTLELVKIFNKPIVEVEKDSTMDQPFKFIIKIETLVALEHPITFTFSYTDGQYEELLKSVNLPASLPKKQRFTAEVPTPTLAKTPLKGLLNGSAILIDVLYNAQILSRIPVHMVVEDQKHELRVQEAEEEDFADEEEVKEQNEAIEEAFGGEEEDFDPQLLMLLQEMAQKKLNQKLGTKEESVAIPQFGTNEIFGRLKRDLVVLGNSVTEGYTKMLIKTIDE
ncbi:ASF1 like histone chaperone domain-containing protein [Spironucleus salmonicida]|uniref:ASF1 like histone chaperone domain-containing protein n=1 Tax=Spironucleus salmonicida TaxID=348837 RepID=V6LF59_9EUKA|nr:ASF1 like histone chaperone domain-containing protein [Spironucleus salmonicida]|eukprot:EST43137.1 ASF1 like histone chaperone domain-containing protein [Spironucleus salmonicida]